ncbi:MAG: hypothetical protein MJ247_04855 [Alphaproteobacteria bacterium]|nr:hypothetical protein [Alphaproteobacteria bacterium]
MREPILKAVAMPPKIFLAPMLPALLNMVLQFPAMFIMMGIYHVNPLMFVVTIAIGHFILIIYGAKEPHLSAMVQAFGKAPKTSQNMYKVKGAKFAP